MEEGSSLPAKESPLQIHLQNKGQSTTHIANGTASKGYNTIRKKGEKFFIEGTTACYWSSILKGTICLPLKG